MPRPLSTDHSAPFVADLFAARTQLMDICSIKRRDHKRFNELVRAIFAVFIMHLARDELPTEAEIISGTLRILKIRKH